MKKWLSLFLITCIGVVGAGCGNDEYVVYKHYDKTDQAYFNYLGCVVKWKFDYKIEKADKGNSILVKKEDLAKIKESCGQ